MPFSKRVGTEPATDLKNRIASLCQEAGFIVVHSQTFLHREDILELSVRRIVTAVHQPGWNPVVPDYLVGTNWEKHAGEQIEVSAFIGCDGTYDGIVELRCMATDNAGDFFGPTLRNCRIPLIELPRWLPEIVRQMQEVIAARKRGEKGPWRFGDQLWDCWKI